MVTEQTPQSLAMHRKPVRALGAAADGDRVAAAGRAERVAGQLVDLADVELRLAGKRP